MSVKRIEFPNAPSGTIDNHQRSMLAIGLDINSFAPVSTFILVKSTTGGMSWRNNSQYSYWPIDNYRAYRIMINNIMWFEFDKQ